MRNIFFPLLVLSTLLALGSSPIPARAETETVALSCSRSASFTSGASCDTFKDSTIDMSRVSKVQLLSSSFDDFGTITITSPSGSTKTITSSNGCPGKSGTIAGQDITSYFGASGSYTVRITATDDPRPVCGTNVSASASLLVTYKGCEGDNAPKCNTPGTCQVGPGECVVVNGQETCEYPADQQGCDLDGNKCTYDICKSNADGTAATCTAGANVCGGMVPCGRLVDDPSTPGDESKTCTFCHLALVANSAIDYLTKLASTLAVLAFIVAGLLYVLSAGNPSRKNAARGYVANIVKGYAVVFLAWLIVDFILSAWGFLNPLMGKWNVVCSFLRLF